MIASGLTNRWPLSSARNLRPFVWGGVALLAGLAVALLSWQASLFLMVLAILFVGSLIDTRVALITTLVIAPLKVLLETEVPFARELPVDIGQIALFATVSIWLARSIATRKRLALCWTPMFVPMLLFLGAAALSLWNTVALPTTLKELVGFSEMIVLVALVVSLMSTNGLNVVNWIVVGLIASGVVQALIGIFEFSGGSGDASLWILDNRYFRAFGSFGQPNPFGAFMGFILALTLGVTYGVATDTWSMFSAIRQSQTESARGDFLRLSIVLGLLILADGILATGLLVSWSRGAWMGFGAAAATLLLFAPRQRWLGLALVSGVILTTVFIFVVGLAPAALVARASDFTQELAFYGDVRGAQISDANYAVVERLAHWQAAIGMANDHPWLGVGYGAYDPAYPAYALLNWPMGLGHAHNYYLNLLAETGVVGLIAYLIMWAIVVSLTLRVLNRETGFCRGVALGILGVWAHLAVHSLFDKLYVNNLPLHLGVMLGLIGGLLIYGTVHDKQRTSRQ
jgi:putative inorganic carbon (hco3(-)) transporter